MSVPTLLAATARAESPSAHDPRFDVIEQLLESADFEGAEAASIRLLASGALSRSEVARAHLELGIVDGARGRMKEAELEFLRAIALDATAALPATVGPELTEAFVRARQRLAAEPSLDVRVEIERSGSPAGLTVKTFIAGMRVGLVRSLEVQGAGVPQKLPLDESSPSAAFHVATTDATCRPLVVRVGDGYGNELWRFLEDPAVCARRDEPVALESEPPRTQSKSAPQAPRRSLPARVWVGTVISANLMIATGVFGIAALNARADYHHIVNDPRVSVSQKRSEHDHASQLQGFATVAGIGAVTSLGVTALLYLTQPKAAARSSASAPRFALSVDPHQALARVQLAF